MGLRWSWRYDPGIRGGLFFVGPNGLCAQCWAFWMGAVGSRGGGVGGLFAGICKFSMIFEAETAIPLSFGIVF